MLLRFARFLERCDDPATVLECAALAWQCAFKPHLRPSRAGAPDFDLMKSSLALWRRIAIAARARASQRRVGHLGKDERPATDACICAAMARMAAIQLLQVQEVLSAARNGPRWTEACFNCFRGAQQAAGWAGQATALWPRDGFAMAVLAECSKTLLKLRQALRSHDAAGGHCSGDMQATMRAARGTHGFPALGSLDICWMFARATLAAEPAPESSLLREPSRTLFKTLDGMVEGHRWQSEPVQAAWATSSRHYRLQRLRYERQRRATVGRPFGALAAVAAGPLDLGDAGRPLDVPATACRNASDAFAARLLHCAWQAMKGELTAERAQEVGLQSGRALRCLARGGHADSTELLKPCVVLMAAARWGQAPIRPAVASTAAVAAAAAASAPAAAAAPAPAGPGAPPGASPFPVIVLLHMCAAAAEEVASVLSGLHERVLLHGQLSSTAMSQAWMAAELEFQAPRTAGGVAFGERVRQRALSAAVAAVNRWREATSAQPKSAAAAPRGFPAVATGPAEPGVPVAGPASKRLRLLPPMRSSHLSEAEAQVDSIVASTALSPDRLLDGSLPGEPMPRRQADWGLGSESPSSASPAPASSESRTGEAASEAGAGRPRTTSDDDDDSDDSDGFFVPELARVIGCPAVGADSGVPADWLPVVDRWVGEAAMSAVLGLGAGLPGSIVEACELRAARAAAGEMLAMAAVLAQWAVACGHLTGPLAPQPPGKRPAKRDADGAPIVSCYGAAEGVADESPPASAAGQDAASPHQCSALSAARRAAVLGLVSAYNRCLPCHSPFLMAADEREMSHLRHGPTMERVRSTASPAEAVAAVGIHAFPPEVHLRLLDTTVFRELRFSLLGSSACIEHTDSASLDIARATRLRLGDLDSWGRSVAGLLCAVRSMSASEHVGVVFTETGVKIAWEEEDGRSSTSGSQQGLAAASGAASSQPSSRRGAGTAGPAAGSGRSHGRAQPGRERAGRAQQPPPRVTEAVSRAFLPAGGSPGPARPALSDAALAAQAPDIPRRPGDAGQWPALGSERDAREATIGTPSEAGLDHGASGVDEHTVLAPLSSPGVAVAGHDDDNGEDDFCDEPTCSDYESGRSGLTAVGSTGVPAPALDVERPDRLFEAQAGAGAAAHGGSVASKMEARARWAGTPPQLFSQAMVARSHLENLDDEGALFILSSARPEREFPRPRDFLRRLLQTFTEEMLVQVFEWARRAVPERHWGTGLPGEQ